MTDYYLSKSVHNILLAIYSQVNGDNTIYWPQGIANKTELRGTKTETKEEFLKRIFQNEDIQEDLLQRNKVSDYLIVFIRLEHNKNVIVRANIQAFVTENISLSNFAQKIEDGSSLNTNEKVFYYRLDYDIKNLGKIFKESLPHIHITPCGTPRMDIKDGQDDLVVNFFDFIYRNHFYEEWFKWVGDNLKNMEKTKLTNLNDIFTANRSEELLTTYKKDLEDIHANIIELKKKHYKWKIEEKYDCLSYFWRL